MNRTNQLIASCIDDIINIRRQLHQRPELGFEEYETQKLIMKMLESWNIPCKPIAKTGVIAFIEGNTQAPVLAIRADIDALPINEENDVPYKSTIDNRMHACGHDAHTAILLGTAFVLKQQQECLNGSVKLFFQPAEETTGGALPMIKENCLSNPPVDAVIGLHVMPSIETGYVEIKKGQLNASSDEVHITVSGKSGHGAYPSLAKDAIYVAAQLITNLQGVVSRMTSPLDSVVLSIGKITGGERGNIICDKVSLAGTLRTLSEDIRSNTKQMISQICKGMAESYDVHIDVHFKDGYEALINDPSITEEFTKIATTIVGEEHIVYKTQPSLGVEDFSFFSNQVPGTFFHLGCANKAKDIASSLHSSTFNIDENCLSIGIALEVESSLHLLNKISMKK